MELSVLSIITSRRITVHDSHGDPSKTRVIGNNDVSQKENYEIEHNDATQHSRSVRGPQWSERNDRQRINLRNFQTKALTFLDTHFTSSGRHIDVDGKTCGAADFNRMITAQGGPIVALSLRRLVF